uniref:Peptidase S1 domain-containing protein n=1 Tax=Oryzias sinensis TaxID=183150 RepID=A0A8C7WXH6_9TELE
YHILTGSEYLFNLFSKIKSFEHFEHVKQFVFGSRYGPNDTVALLGVQNQLGENPHKDNRTIDDFVCYGDKYDYHSKDSICLLLLSAPVNFSEAIQPIALASRRSTFHNGTLSWVTVFDSYDHNETILQEVKASIVGNNQCNCDYEGEEISDKQMCVGLGDEGYDACEVTISSTFVFLLTILMHIHIILSCWP